MNDVYCPIDIKCNVLTCLYQQILENGEMLGLMFRQNCIPHVVITMILLFRKKVLLLASFTAGNKSAKIPS